MSRSPLHVLVTRPQGQQQALVTALLEAGFVVSQQSALCIEPFPLSAVERSLLLNLDQYHAVFFVSANAARLALQALDELWPQWPVGVHWLAVGPATAEVLSAAGMQAELPRTGFDSEAVLELDCLRDLPGKRVLICSGEGGRELFANTLQRRGAEVDVLPLYQRVCNAGFAWPAEPVDMVLVTSLQGWHCIAGKVAPGCRVVVASERIGAAVGDAFPVTVAASARDKDMLAAVIRLQQDRGSSGDVLV